MPNKKDLLKDYKKLYKAYMNLRKELNLINGTANSKELKKLIN